VLESGWYTWYSSGKESDRKDEMIQCVYTFIIIITVICMDGWMVSVCVCVCVGSRTAGKKRENGDDTIILWFCCSFICYPYASAGSGGNNKMLYTFPSYFFFLWSLF